MKFFKEIKPEATEAQPPTTKPVPMRSKSRIATDDDGGHLTDLSGVARHLGVSKRYVQTLVRRRMIPAIRLGRRCTRFDLDGVRTALKKYEVNPS